MSRTDVKIMAIMVAISPLIWSMMAIVWIADRYHGRRGEGFPF